MPGVKSAVKSSRDVYFVSPLVDVLVAGGGASILFFFVVLAMGRGPFQSISFERPTWAVTTAYALMFVVNYPHFAATNFRLYQSFDRMMQFPKTSFLSPVVVCAGLAWALVDQNFAGWYAKIFITWSGYHFCAQTKGIALLYARRLGIEIDKTSRWLLIIAVHTPWVFGALRSETFANLGPFWGVTIPRGLPWGIAFPFAWSDVIVNIAWGAFWVGCACMVLLILRVALKYGRFLPAAVVVPSLAQMLWFGPLGSGSAVFNEFVPFFHSLQYMLIAWLFQLKEESARNGFLPGIDVVVWESIKWLALVIAGGVTLFILWPHAIAWRGYALPNALACVHAAIQIHHFFVDGVIWKIRDPRTRSMLAGNLFDLAGVEREVAGAPLVAA